LISKIIASDLREIASRLYKVGGYPTLDRSPAIGENLIMTAITMVEAQELQTPYGSGNEMIFVVGDKVWLSTTIFKTSRPSKDLHLKRTGPYTVTMII